MRKLVVGVIFLCVVACSSPAQQKSFTATPSNVAADFAATSGANIPLTTTSAVPRTSYSSSDFAPDTSIPAALLSDTLSSAIAFPEMVTALAVPVPPEPAPSAAPAKLHFPRGERTDRDYSRWELGFGVSLERFRSSIYRATGVGTHTSITYQYRGSLGIEGNVSTFFAPKIWTNQPIRLVNYGAGPKMVWQETSDLQLFAHVLVGGTHVLPQTAASGQSGFAIQAGGGATYPLFKRLALQAEADYLATHIFSAWQSNLQAFLGVVIRF